MKDDDCPLISRGNLSQYAAGGVGGVGYKIRGRRGLAAGIGVHFHRDEHLQDYRYCTLRLRTFSPSYNLSPHSAMRCQVQRVLTIIYK